MSVEKILCDLMEYSRAILFPRARDALSAWCAMTAGKIRIPTNCCPALLPFASELVPIDPTTGLAPVPVQLYGYRQEFLNAKIEIDPLMTGLLGKPFADSTIVSFGYAKTIDIGGGGAILTQDTLLAGELQRWGFFPQVLRSPLQDAIENVHTTIMRKKRDYEEIESEYANEVIRLPDRPVIPWRFVARERRALNYKWKDFKFSKNYPPLPGVTDEGAIQFGKEVINIWR